MEVFEDISDRYLCLMILAALIFGIILVLFGFFSGNFPDSFMGSGSDRNPNFEFKARVDEVIDGDTIRIEILEEYDPHQGIGLDNNKVRFVGVDTEELKQREAGESHPSVKDFSQTEYEKTEYYSEALEAKKTLENIVSVGSTVYLDVDDLAYGSKPYRGSYGRIIAVVYRKLEGRWVNVNGRVLRDVNLSDRGNYSKVSYTYVSEFNPFRWLSDKYPYI